MNSCYDDSVLRRYHAGELDPSEDARVRAHLEECSACKHRDDRLISGQDRLIHMLRSLKVSSTFDSDQAGGGSVATVTQRPSAVPPDTTEDVRLSVEGYQVIREIQKTGSRWFDCGLRSEDTRYLFLHANSLRNSNTRTQPSQRSCGVSILLPVVRKWSMRFRKLEAYATQSE